MAHQKRWTSDDDDYLISLIQCGWSTKRIAAVMQRTVRSIWKRAERHGGMDVLRNGETFSVRSIRQVASLFGVDPRIVRYWIEQKWMRGHRNRAEAAHSHRQRYLIPDESIQEFMKHDVAWMMWHPADITDRDWQQYASSVRPATEREWYTIAETAAYIGISPNHIRTLCRTGTLRSVQHTTTWYIWAAQGTLIPYRIYYRKQAWRKAIQKRKQEYVTLRQTYS